ncbi:MAG TPA: DUF4384 domain-containing protein [Ottowia sp.]|uniref:DUF4384 domain-containing protein n=1 Tax=Ottowia sp. TaxID=1898956 RepID=UPI002B74166B|nr:DUF4384 domain-containing protein [Ottowia sp.]HMN21129.1 DUF4384 domain-containing protein [Ottowia sp.]
MSQPSLSRATPYRRPGARTWLLAAAASAALLAGCATPISPKDDALFQSYASTHDRPATRPVRSMSSFSDALACMDEMMREAEVPTMLITSTFIPDFSGRVPVAAKQMVVTALSQMSRRSNAFRYVDFEVDIARQDTVQNLTTILLNNNQMELQRPALYVSGGISFVDQNVLNARHSAGVSGPRVEAGYDRSRGATIVGLEMHLGDFRTRTLIPGLDSANEVIIGSSGQGLDLAGRIGSYGVQFNVGRDLTQGTGAAMRTLVDLALIELAGKWTHLPYWRCLTLDNTHPEFQRQLREWYDEADPANRSRLVQRYLASRGYLPTFEQPLPPNSAVLREAVGRFQADVGAVVTGEMDFSLYERALREFVAVGEDGQLTRIGWGELGNGDVKPVPLAIDMQIENTVKDRTAFPPGTNIFASVTVTRAAYLFCYLKDGNGNVVKLLPNMLHPDALVSANQAVRLPDWMVPYPAFVLTSGKQGSESLMCVASSEDPMTRMPQELNVDALTPIQGVKSLDEMRAHFETAVGAEKMASQTLEWHILAPAPAGNGKN